MSFFSVRTAVLLLLAWLVVSKIREVWRRKGTWRVLLVWIFVAVGGYIGLVLWVDGPGAKLLDGLPMWAAAVLVAAVALPVLFSLCELAFRAIDGPFPVLPPGVQAVRVHRGKITPWIPMAAVGIALMAVVGRFLPASWDEYWWPATFVTALFAPMAFWFLLYRARRFDYGRTALLSNYWSHWVYTDELEAFTGLDPKAPQEAWMGPAGLLFVGDFAPWDLSTYEVIEAETRAGSPPRIHFQFKQTGFGNSVSYDTYNVAIPKGREADLVRVQQELRVLRPKAKIDLVKTE
jgi:hypothetical protein